MSLVFVYGTLKKGFYNHHWLSGQTFIGLARLKGHTLYNLGSYPGMLPHPGGSVRGEVWSVSNDCMRELDELEGIEYGLYRREIVALEEPAYGGLAVTTYVYNRALDNSHVHIGDFYEAAPKL